jgi:pimeloyl-ACP methyl ester carboxylesterase
MYLRPMRMEELKPSAFEEIHVDGSPVWVIGPKSATGAFVMCHGYGGSRYTWVDAAMRLSEQGFRCYIPSMPGHGSSPVSEVGFGTSESVLASQVAAKAREETGGPVVGVGVSMGGAAILLACERNPAVFDAICAESAFASLPDATNAFLDRALPGGSVTFAPVRWIAERRSGLRSRDIQPIRGAIAIKGKPALIMHGTGDRLFPIQFSEEIAEAVGADLWRVPDARHAYCYDVATEEYLGRLQKLAESAR